MGKTLLFLDFDGVICNSVLECLYSATVSYYVKYLGKRIDSLPLRIKEDFLRYRPFIRTGEDFVVLVDLVARGVKVECQEDFDRALREHPEETLALFRSLFYETRRELIRDEFLFWMGLNPLYPGVRDPLRKISANPLAYILSTKIADLIFKILQYHGVEWPVERILLAEKLSKKEIIGSLLDRSEGEGAILLDDQLDHLRVAKDDPRISPFLASWGYVKPDWLKRGDVPLLHLEEFGSFLENFSYSWESSFSNRN